MQSRILNTLSTLVLMVITFSGGFLYGQSPAAPIQVFGSTTLPFGEAKDEFGPFWEVWHLVRQYYFDQTVTDTTLAQGAIEGLLATLDDPNTRYLPPSDEEATRQEMEGEFQGIGAEVEDVDGNITVVAPIEGSPAEAAGIRPGDILREADGVVLTGMAVDQAAALVRGPAGTTVHLKVERDGEIIELDITRDVIKVPSVRGEMLENNIAYVRLSRFGNNTAEELNLLLTDLMAQNPTGLILDLRSNPGGGLTTAVDVADQFLPEGNILIERFGNGDETVYDATEEGLAQDVPMVVLIDEGSASASEVLAGAIQDRERGTLIGQTSFGKGTVQTWQGLSNGGGVRITIARWLTPNERWVHGEGLQPDYFIPLPQVENVEEFEDTQLQAAIDFLSGETLISVPPDEDGETSEQ